MKICPTCGNEYPDDCNFCNACGVELVQKPQAQKQTLVENVTPITPTTLKEFYQKQKKDLFSLGKLLMQQNKGFLSMLTDCKHSCQKVK